MQQYWEHHLRLSQHASGSFQQHWGERRTRVCVMPSSQPPTELLSGVSETCMVHILRCAWNDSLSASLLTLQALNHTLPHFFPLHRQIWWSYIALTSPSIGEPHRLRLLSHFSLICACGVPPVGLQLPVLRVRQGIFAGYFPRLGVISSPWTERVLLAGTSSSLVQSPTTSPLQCSAVTSFHLQKDLILNPMLLSNQVLSTPYRMWNNYGEQINLSGQLERWCGTESCPLPLAYSPPTPPRRCGCKWISTKAPKMKGLRRMHFPWGL